MELDLDFRKVLCCKASEEKKAVIPVDCSIILPDYFPDVMKILRYTAKTVKFPVFSEDGSETVSGNVNIEVSYVSEEGELCSCSQLQPFSHSFEIKGKNFAAEADVSVGEIGCRAVNRRRIDLHGSIEVRLRTLCGEEKNLVSSAKGAGTVCKTKSTETILMAGDFYKNFTVEEKSELGYGKPPFGKVIRSYAFAEVSECHVIQNKIVAKGEVKVKFLWVPEEPNENGENGPFIAAFNYPVSKMLDAEGILPSDICDARFEADFPEITSCEDGQNVLVKIKVGIFARVYRKERIDFIEDMFSTDFETKIEKGKISIISEALPFSSTETFFERFDLPESAKTVTDIWTEPNEPGMTQEGKIILGTKICMFAKDEDESPVYFEKNIEKEISFPGEEKNVVFYNLCSGIRNEEFSFGSDGKAEISASVLIDGTIYSGMSTDAVTACSVDTEKKIEHESTAMVFCFAEKGENIWDIAKKYRASAENIREENGISDEVLAEKTMIVITR